jgi:HTH-type transcriptional regulator / antitoxin MqsA
MTKQKNEACPVCFKGHLARKSKRIRAAYRGHTITYIQPGDWCDHCDEGVLTGSDAQATNAKLTLWREEVDREEALVLGVIRRRLRLTQQEAAQIAGGGKNAFSRYETGKAHPVRAVSVLFKLLDRHPSLVNEVKELAAP